MNSSAYKRAEDGGCVAWFGRPIERGCDVAIAVIGSDGTFFVDVDNHWLCVCASARVKKPRSFYVKVYNPDGGSGMEGRVETNGGVPLKDILVDSKAGDRYRVTMVDEGGGLFWDCQLLVFDCATIHAQMEVVKTWPAPYLTVQDERDVLLKKRMNVSTGMRAYFVDPSTTKLYLTSCILENGLDLYFKNIMVDMICHCGGVQIGGSMPVDGTAVDYYRGIVTNELAINLDEVEKAPIEVTFYASWNYEVVVDFGSLLSNRPWVGHVKAMAFRKLSKQSLMIIRDGEDEGLAVQSRDCTKKRKPQQNLFSDANNCCRVVTYSAIIYDD